MMPAMIDRRSSILGILSLSASLHFIGAAALAHDECVTEPMQAYLRSLIERNRAQLAMPAPPAAPEGGLADGDGLASSPMYRFYPMAGNMQADIVNGSFVDLDPGNGAFHDFECRPFTRDAHAGVDTSIPSFAQQWIGVPVFAARDGTVVFVNDGEPDENINGGFLGNLVVLDHGDGFESQYWHLKKDSIPVVLGQVVKAGQQIGMVGSSGNSFGPHLHFQTMAFDGSQWQVYDPFHGACNPGDPDFVDQADLDTEALVLYDFGITRTDLFTLEHPWWEPWPLPVDPQIAVTDDSVVFWWYVYNFPAQCQIGVKFIRPDGSVADDSSWNWGNPAVIRSYSNWFAWSVEWLQPMVGTWHLHFSLNGQLLIDAPFEMVTTIDPGFNRPPEPIGAAFDPPSADPDEVIFCRVITTPVKEDLDWDVVRYHYAWRVNGLLVREVTTAAHSDAIPRATGSSGRALSCTVTAGDGVASAAPVTLNGAFGGLLGDFNGDGEVDGDDLGTLLGEWGPCPGCQSDFNGSGTVDGDDLGSLLGSWN